MEADTTIRAPQNPYRDPVREGMVQADFSGVFREAYRELPRRFDGDRGPGLTASDLDRLVRQHFFDGFSKAEREGEAKVEEMRSHLGDAFDEGYTAGIVQRAQGLAGDVRSRLIELHFILMQIEGAPKSKRVEMLPVLRNVLDDLTEFVAVVLTDAQEAAAQEAAG